MKYTNLVSCAIFAFITTSCSITKKVTLTPTQGKLAQQGITSIPAKFTWNGSGSGKAEVQMPDGELCVGRYSTIVRGSNSYHSGQSYSNYGSYGNNPYNLGVYGSTSYSGVGHTYSNDQRGRAIVRGNKGRVITLNYVTSANSPTHGHGQGYDNKGNRYSIVY